MFIIYKFWLQLKKMTTLKSVHVQYVEKNNKIFVKIEFSM